MHYFRYNIPFLLDKPGQGNRQIIKQLSLKLEFKKKTTNLELSSKQTYFNFDLLLAKAFYIESSFKLDIGNIFQDVIPIAIFSYCYFSFLQLCQMSILNSGYRERCTRLTRICLSAQMFLRIILSKINCVVVLCYFTITNVISFHNTIQFYYCISYVSICILRIQ